MLSERLMQFIDVDLHGVKVRVTTSCPQKIKHTTEICIYVGSTSGFALLHGYMACVLDFLLDPNFKPFASDNEKIA